MVLQRISSKNIVLPTILGESLIFPTSKRTVKNRFLKAALSERFAKWSLNDIDNGIPNDKLVNLYQKWGNSGFGMIFTGNILVDKDHIESLGNMIIDESLDSKKRKEMFKKLAKVGKSGNSLMIAQLNHAGRQTPLSINQTPYSCSNVKQPDIPNTLLTFGNPIELTKNEIKTKVIEKFAYAAQYCYECGFDGIEVHAAHGFLLAQFLSNKTNKRDDEYGGSIENKMRIIVEIYNEIRKRIPKETGFVVGIKLNSVEFQNEDSKTDEAEEIAKKMDEIGFDFIELSGGTYEKWGMETPENSKREGYFEIFAKSIKKNIKSAKVYLTGGFRTVEGMVSSIKSNATDGIGLARPITGEPNLPLKIINNEVDSAPLNLLEPYGFTFTALGSSSQMIQMSKKSLEESDNNPCYEVMDLSDPNVVKKYSEKANTFFSELMSKDKKEEPAVVLLDVDFKEF